MRYSFEEIIKSLNSLLEDVAGYLDFSAINNANVTTAYDHLARGYDHLIPGYDHLEVKETNGP